MTNEQAFFRIIQDYSKGVEVKGKSAYIRLMQLKSRYYQETLPSIKDEINQLLPHIPEYREEIFQKLSNFFSHCFSPTGTLCCRYQPGQIFHHQINNREDVFLHWASHMFYYMKADRPYVNLEVKLNKVKFFFDTSALQSKRVNGQSGISYQFRGKKEDFPFDDETEILINPSGRFVEGGPAADTGLTGRKIMVDTYGGLASHGGGALSGKDPTKVDRSGAYMARYIAKHIVWCGYAKRCEVSISYAIGKANPVAFSVNTLGTGIVSDEILTLAAQEIFNLRPAAIIEKLRLRYVIYSDTAVYGHFNSCLFPWEGKSTLFRTVC
jgi:hypothetical protein